MPLRAATGRRILGAVLASVLPAMLLLAGTGRAAAQDAGAVDALTRNGVYVEPGAAGDVDALRRVVDDAPPEVGLRVAVHAARGQIRAEQTADAYRASVGGGRDVTVVVFTPDEVGVSSSRYDSAEIDRAFERAGDRARAADPAEATRALVQALTEEGPPWVLIAVAGIVAVVVLALLGRVVEQRRTRARDEAALDEIKDALRARLQSAAEAIIDLEPSVVLSQDDAVRTRFAEATGEFTRIREAYQVARSRRALDRCAQDLDAVDGVLAAVRSAIGG